MSTRRRRAARLKEATDLNVTAFMNLMVVLVPFLLIMAVFSRITIHELNMPAAGGEQPLDKPRLQLEVILRTDRVDVGDRAGGVVASLPATAEGYDLEALSNALRRIKQQFPDELGATILLEPTVPYDRLIQVMDTVRQFETGAAGTVRSKYELFPEISLGDAPQPATERKGS
ncbi:MAG: biopolymer transporter ExbD [Gammaproteobacteria bacterium HGW-Gammaproteobacteria-1]|jgi:biopolymer transport protein ExbD|nr:MAG: biopolymer transporter ExbD [Gammaproteobacteria bacterium HGW-Gammaproteobacteria-1]